MKKIISSNYHGSNETRNEIVTSWLITNDIQYFIPPLLVTLQFIDN